MKITPELSGAGNYPMWKRQMELALSAKRKLGYVDGSLSKPHKDEAKIEAWEAGNSLVISWIMQSVSERIKLVIMYTQSVAEIWETLRRRYTVANGSRKYKLNKDTYDISQNNRPIEEYYTELQIVWDELENLNNYPLITKVTDEMKKYFEAVEKQSEERKLFQFLNGLDLEYVNLRSNLLLMNPLPTVDTTVSILLQEEAQTSNAKGNKSMEASALLAKGEIAENSCKYCQKSNHKSSQCWEILDYPNGHPKQKKQGHNNNVMRNNSGEYKPQGEYYSQGGYKPQGGYRPRGDLREAIGHKEATDPPTVTKGRTPIISVTANHIRITVKVEGR
ncbi:uncharacterized protein LOC141641579 [Silene latifolia]|uniref:uncharacterized protein LOC141641579 n=1 Tax=Silene latifolia TaxID=37657 RepID=UPI003D784EA4